MRKEYKKQFVCGQVDVSQVELDLTSRDEIPKLLLGLQGIYKSPKVLAEIFKKLAQLIPQGIDAEKGREGMTLWEILVLGCLRLICNYDWDSLKEQADNHSTLRLFLGISPILDASKKYGLQTLRDNIARFTPEILRQINQEIVTLGHRICGKDDGDPLFGRCDSWVVQTNVHFPTDINLLFDAIRKVMVLTSRLCLEMGIPGWRQSGANLKKIRKLYHRARKIRYSNSQNPEKRAEKERIKQEAYLAYSDLVESWLKQSIDVIGLIRNRYAGMEPYLMEIEYFIGHAQKQIDFIRRRVIEKKSIPHHEKIFSVFEEHTEWICKGKSGVPQELGVRVAIVEDQYGFILNHQVAFNQTDDKIAVPMIEETVARFPDLKSCSFDKGFHSPGNQKELAELLDRVVLPKKGKLSKAARENERTEAFKAARKRHSAVESAIASLQNHGLKRCPDKGKKAFERYIGLGVLAFNIHRLGTIIQRKKQKEEARKEKYRNTYLGNRQYTAA